MIKFSVLPLKQGLILSCYLAFGGSFAFVSVVFDFSVNTSFFFIISVITFGLWQLLCCFHSPYLVYNYCMIYFVRH